ncbi:MAG: hypothetical protein U0904_09040 [Candidatus Nanopelagicales bacterium]|nr:hypothetical protein [Candidatus Nanopelagicales bacterium]
MVKIVAGGTDDDTVSSAARRGGACRRGPLRIATAIVAACAVVAAPAAIAATVISFKVPAPTVQLPAEVDWQAEYQGQTLCTPTAKPGTLRLGKLLDDTYGKFTQYIARSCATPGTSEHEEGRALDWMVNSKIAKQRKKAFQFLNWAIAPGPNGEPGAMARRLGIMYLIYENKIWGVYSPQAGWREYQNCSSSGKSSSSYDTVCHRDHIHISQTWDGAYGTTSFWTGVAETRGPCSSSTASRTNGTSDKPTTLLNTHSGIGLASSRCRLAAGTSYTSRTYKVKVPVPTVAAGYTPVQRIKITKMNLNAPSSVWVSSAASKSVPRGAKLPISMDIPLNSKGLITFSVGAGYSRFKVRGLGTGAPLPPPSPSVALSPPSGQVHVGDALSLVGSVANIASGTSLTIKRKLVGGAFADLTTQSAKTGAYSIASTAPATPGTYVYRAVINKNGQKLDRSAKRRVEVLPSAVVVTSAKSPVAAGKQTRVRGTVAGAPTGSRIVLRRKLDGYKWRKAGEMPAANGSFAAKALLPIPGKYKVRAIVKSGSTRVARSGKLRVRAR